MTKDATWAGQASALGAAETIQAAGELPAQNGQLTTLQACLLAGAAESRARNFQKAKVHFDKCREVMHEGTDDPRQHFAIAKHYADIDAFAPALEILETLATRPQENRDVLHLLGVTARQAGKLEMAVSAHRKLLEKEPSNTELYKDLTLALLAQRNADEALKAVEDWLKITPASADALSLKVVATNEAKGRSAVADLLDFDKLVSMSELAPPEGYGSADTYNMSLMTAVLAELVQSSRRDSSGYKSTDELFGAETGPLRELENQICDHIDAFYERFDKRRKQPFIRSIPDTYMLDGWGRVYGGHTDPTPQIHGDAHLCGYYFVQVPSSEEMGKRTVEVNVGTAPEGLGCAKKLPSLNVWPKQGSIVLFPAYMYQQVKPLVADQQMICIAFSVMPV